MGVTHLLDYGCGSNCNLAKKLKADHKVTYQAYDPGVPKYSKEPLPAQMVACIDVLEHIEADKLDAVLDDIVRVCEGIAFLSIDTKAAGKWLSDGRNAHLTQEPMQWWLPKLWDRWDLQTIQVGNDRCFFVIGLAKPRIEATDGSLL